MASTTKKVLRVGVIGTGEVAQVVHLPNLLHLKDLFRVTAICDISKDSLSASASKYNLSITQCFNEPAYLCKSSSVDIVFVLSADEFHVEHVLLALKGRKHVFVEKPIALTTLEVDAIIQAEEDTKGACKVFVGYQRRYASTFVDFAKAEFESLRNSDGGITHARVRDIIGPNSTFVSQSGTFPQQFPFSADSPETERKKLHAKAIMEFAPFTKSIPVPDLALFEYRKLESFYRLLGGLGSHDLSLMREILGMPESVLGGSYNIRPKNGTRFWTALLQYPGFVVVYESGIDHISRFDAHIEVFSAKKSVRIEYDTPYVKGLPVKAIVRENFGADGRGLSERTIMSSYEDGYTREMKELWECCVNGKEVKTSARDAKQDVILFGMIVEAVFGKYKGTS